MPTPTDIKESQRQWAISKGLEPDDKGYLDSVESNLFQPLSDKTRAQFENGSGSELEDGKTRPAKMRALHSSSGLAVNFFDHWVDIEKSALQAALGLDQEIVSVSFEEQFPTGLDGNLPNVDVTLKLSGGHLIGIESKFSEWLTPKTKSSVPFQPKYFPEGGRLWADVGLPESQRLAEAINNGEESFRYLYAPQLLKHALGMATGLGSAFSLYYIFYDWPCEASETHYKEVTRFADLVGNELRFRGVTYQELFDDIYYGGGADCKYLEYLHERYS